MHHWVTVHMAHRRELPADTDTDYLPDDVLWTLVTNRNTEVSAVPHGTLPDDDVLSALIRNRASVDAVKLYIRHRRCTNTITHEHVVAAVRHGSLSLLKRLTEDEMRYMNPVPPLEGLRANHTTADSVAAVWAARWRCPLVVAASLGAGPLLNHLLMSVVTSFPTHVAAVTIAMYYAALANSVPCVEATMAVLCGLLSPRTRAHELWGVTANRGVLTLLLRADAAKVLIYLLSTGALRRTVSLGRLIMVHGHKAVLAATRSLACVKLARRSVLGSWVRDGTVMAAATAQAALDFTCLVKEGDCLKRVVEWDVRHKKRAGPTEFDVLDSDSGSDVESEVEHAVASKGAATSGCDDSDNDSDSDSEEEVPERDSRPSSYKRRCVSAGL